MTAHYRGDPDRLDEMLSAYLDGDLSPAEAASVRDTLDGDPAVRERYREMTATVALLRDLPSPAPRRSFTLSPEQARSIRPDFPGNGIAVRQFAGDDSAPVVLPYAAAPAPAPMAPPPGGALPPNVTPLRPRSPLARLVPISGALSAVAAVLLFAVLAIDLSGGTGGNEGVSAPATTGGTGLPESVLTPGPTLAPAANAPAPAAARSGATNATGASGAPAAMNPAPAQAPLIAQATVAAQPTLAPVPTVAPRPASGPAAEDAPNALLRAAEIALAVLLLAGIIGLILGLRARRQIPTAG